MLLGDFEYSELNQANPAYATAYFFMYMLSMFMVMVNIFLAILGDSYNIARDDSMRRTNPTYELGPIGTTNRKGT